MPGRTGRKLSGSGAERAARRASRAPPRGDDLVMGSVIVSLMVLPYEKKDESRCLSPKPQVGGVVQGFLLHGGAAHMAEDFDLHFGPRRCQVGTNVGQSHVLLQSVAPNARSG